MNRFITLSTAKGPVVFNVARILMFYPPGSVDGKGNASPDAGPTKVTIAAYGGHDTNVTVQESADQIRSLIRNVEITNTPVRP